MANYKKLYTRNPTWVNKSVAKTTPITATKLNAWEDFFENLDNRVVELGNNTKKITFATEEPETVETDTIVMVYEE